MQMLTTLLITSLFLLVGCARDTPADAPVLPPAPRDTLVLETSRQKGWGLMPGGVGTLGLKDTAFAFAYPVKYPGELAILGASSHPVDLTNPDLDRIDILIGERNRRKVFVVDENDNQDFRDDPVRLLDTIDWKDGEGVPVTFRVREGDSVYQSTSYMRIGESLIGTGIGTFEHLTAEVNVRGVAYHLGLTSPGSSDFTYDRHLELAVLEEDGVPRDTLTRPDYVSMNEYIVLNEVPYRVDSISHSGDRLRLVRDPAYASTYGNQAGMLAPDFSGVTLTGDTLLREDLADRPILIANSCACGDDPRSAEAIADVRAAYGDYLFVLRLDSGKRDLTQGPYFDMEDPANRELYDAYREEYCSRVAYLIGRDGRIAERFDIMDWRRTLPGLRERGVIGN